MNIGDTRRTVAVVVFSLILLVSVLSPLYLPKKEEEVKGIDIQRDISAQYPYITNLMPNIAYVGEEYVFVPRIVISEFGDPVITVKEGPSWITVDEELIIRGTPEMEDVGTYKVVLRIQDGIGSSEISDYIIVQSNEE
jgi:hypothetical protein